MVKEYEIPTDEELQGMNQQEFLKHTTELLAEVKRLKAKLFEAELWVVNDSYTFENCLKELNE